MNIVITGHVDHGKSTIIGRILYDTGSVSRDSVDRIKNNCISNSRQFEYAYITDVIKEEQCRGITLDSARVFFKTGKRQYRIMDAPGHTGLLRNMVTGASYADAAFLVIDAAEGICENSRRHGYLLSMLSIKKIAVIINKMDLVNYEQKAFEKIKKEYSAFLQTICLNSEFIPVSGLNGDNIVFKSINMPWFNGHTIIKTLDSFPQEHTEIDESFRMPVQDIYDFIKSEYKGKIIAGRICTGTLNAGDEICFYPSTRKDIVKKIVQFGETSKKTAYAGESVGLILGHDTLAERGDIAAKSGENCPYSVNRFLASIFWLNNIPLIKNKKYILKLGACRVEMHVEEICKVINSSDLKIQNNKGFVNHHNVAECIIKTNRKIALDLSEKSIQTGRFVIADNFNISGGGIVRSIDI
ncbi:MAG: 50S ribosome-binding GTPase [Spirochaetes bacterium]|nr:50S ribosome-binding GTPase [Spirochaetota bacterium]